MRYMLLLKGDPEPGRPPDAAVAAAMGTYLDELTRAGVLLAAEGLRPSSAGVRLRFDGGVRSLIEGPFVESKPVAGYLVLQAKSREEAVEWASRCPIGGTPGEADAADIEIRQVVDWPDGR
jgi:hypothetical protein